MNYIHTYMGWDTEQQPDTQHCSPYTYSLMCNISVYCFVKYQHFQCAITQILPLSTLLFINLLVYPLCCYNTVINAAISDLSSRLIKPWNQPGDTFQCHASQFAETWPVNSSFRRPQDVERLDFRWDTGVEDHSTHTDHPESFPDFHTGFREEF